MNQVTAHNGEIQISLEGTYTRTAWLVSISTPFSTVTYINLEEEYPDISELTWEKTTCGMGDSTNFQATIQNVFRDSEIIGTLEVNIARHSYYGTGEIYETIAFPIVLAPGESVQVDEAYTPMKDTMHTLLASWNSKGLELETESILRVNEGRYQLENVFWTIGNQMTSTAKVGDIVTAHIILKAYEAAVEDFLTIYIRRDLFFAFDTDHEVSSQQFLILKNHQKELEVTFSADSQSGSWFNGYYVEIKFSNGSLWTMEKTYPPSLRVN
jgi:hypothetical protein